MPLFRRKAEVPKAKPVWDDTLGVPEVAAAKARAAAGDFDGAVDVFRGASSVGNAHAALKAIAEAAPIEQVSEWSDQRRGDQAAATILGLALIAEGWRMATDLPPRPNGVRQSRWQ